MTTEPNTAEEIFRKNEKGRMLTYRNTPEFIIEAMQEHTAQTLDRLKEEVGNRYRNKEFEQQGYGDGYLDGLAWVLKLIEEVSDE